MVFGRRKQQAGEEIGAPPEERTRLTPVDVQQKVLRLAFRGYNEQDVDRFLDHVTEDLAALHEENKRLHEELELRGPGGGGEEARRHAEEIIRRAREEAARIAGGEAAPGAAVPSAYLVRERQFLQRLAELVQQHAGSLKQEARRARDASSSPEDEADPEEPEAEEPSTEDAQEQPAPRKEAGPESSEPQESQLEETAAMAPPVEPGELAEWTNPFVTEEEGGEHAESGEDQEPSLRELFWGEE